MYDDIPRTRVPADIGTPDRIAFGLTFRQLAIVGSVAVPCWLIYRSLSRLLPPLVWLILAVAVAGLTMTIALGRRDGRPLDAWLLDAITFAASPKIQTPGRPQLPLTASTANPVMPELLQPVITGITAAGTFVSDNLDRRMIACGTTNLHLRTGEEQEALLEAHGQFLNSLSAPAQIVISTQRDDLTPIAEMVVELSTSLPDHALRNAAADYASFLLDLNEQREPLRRQIITVVSGTRGGDNAARSLARTGVSADVLDGSQVMSVLTASADQFRSPTATGARALPGEPVTLRSSQ
ncbi:hypothetical protein HDA40_001906 [Hamadaea flava]|uniref:PrgI family protein n=1 Tax=Hamadaea flava TaxID=1742688 RepID=A0ABV8LFC6_9ACTN|nr:PrgI family protein [Hamadaea flava]MCP2323399.1 hypothetical protein [Hamadaea flava]